MSTTPTPRTDAGASQCTTCGAKFVFTPGGPKPPPQECRSCRVKTLERELSAALSREAKLRDVLREVSRFYSKKDGFNREGYSLFVDPDTALRDINYRDAKLWPTVEEAIDGAIAALNSQPSEV